jgi:hypothetical protein
LARLLCKGYGAKTPASALRHLQPSSSHFALARSRRSRASVP